MATIKEEKVIEQLLQTVKELKEDNAKFKQSVSDYILAVNTKVNNKHLPINFEAQILEATKMSIADSIQKALVGGYNNPLHKLIEGVINEHSKELKDIVTRAFDSAIKTEDFESSIKDAFLHKISRLMISANDGMVEKITNELRQDAVFRAKMVTAIAQIIEDIRIKSPVK